MPNGAACIDCFGRQGLSLSAGRQESHVYESGPPSNLSQHAVRVKGQQHSIYYVMVTCVFGHFI